MFSNWGWLKVSVPSLLMRVPFVSVHLVTYFPRNVPGALTTTRVGLLSCLCHLLALAAHLPCYVSNSLCLGWLGWTAATSLSGQCWALPPQAVRVAPQSFLTIPVAPRKLRALQQTIPAHLCFRLLPNRLICLPCALTDGPMGKKCAAVKIPNLGDKRNPMWWKRSWNEAEVREKMVGRLPTDDLVPRLQGSGSRSLSPRHCSRPTNPFSLQIPARQRFLWSLDGQEVYSFSKLISWTQIYPFPEILKVARKFIVDSKSQANVSSQRQKLFFSFFFFVLPPYQVMSEDLLCISDYYPLIFLNDLPTYSLWPLALCFHNQARTLPSSSIATC